MLYNEAANVQNRKRVDDVCLLGGVQVLMESAGGSAWNVATNQESFAPVVSS